MKNATHLFHSSSLARISHPRLLPHLIALALAAGTPAAQADGAFQGLGTLGGNDSYAYGISIFGNAVVGYAVNGGANDRAFRWTGSGGMQDLGTLGGNNSWANGVSGDGSVVVGEAEIAGGASRAFRWTSGGGMQNLGTLGGTFSAANSVSGDGAVVVGEALIAGGDARAFRWTSGSGMQNLGVLPGGTFSVAIGVSGDGAVVVGLAEIAGGDSRAFRWTSGSGMQDLGVLPGGTKSGASGVSGDGAVVVGTGFLGGAWHASRWTSGTGMQSVADWVAGAGISTAGWSLEQAYSTNADGSVVVGTGVNPSGHTEAWLARVSPYGSGIINPTTFNASIIDAASRAVQAGASIANLSLFGAHHRSLLDSGLARTRDGVCAWATGDYARYGENDSRIGLAEGGLCKDFGSLRVGAGVGRAWARQDWKYGGKADYDGNYLVAELANAFGNGIEASVTGYYGRFDADLHRKYQNGAMMDTSVGKSDAHSGAIRARLDWKDAFKAGSFAFTPYAAYTHIRTKLDGYTEHGGGFPVTYSSSSWRTDDLRGGLAALTALSNNTSLRLGGELVHRFDDHTNGVKGQVLGLWGYSLPGQQVKQNWVRALVDIDHRLSANHLITVGANAATKGGDPTWGLTIGYRGSF